MLISARLSAMGYPKTGSGEIKGDFLEADFWPVSSNNSKLA